MNWFQRLIAALFRRRPPVTPPTPPALRPIAVNTGVSGARVRLEAPQGHFETMADHAGRAGFPEVPEAMTEANLFIEADGYAWYGQVVPLPPGGQDLFPILVSLFKKRAGLVRAEGKAVRDDDGLFHPLILTMFWAYQGWTRDQPRFKQNIEFLRPYGYDGVRIAGHVTWNNWAVNPLDPDYEPVMRDLIDYLYDEAGLRTEAFLIGDDGPGRAYGMAQAARWARIVKGREHKILSLEATNEGHVDLPTMIEMVKFLRANTSVQLIALSDRSPLTTQAPLIAAFHAAGATEFTIHTDRGGGPERMARQGHDFFRFPGIGNSNEPPGPHSSIASVTDPRWLAMFRANVILGKGAKFCLHIADMVTGQLNPHHPARRANLWEIDNIDQILKVVRGIDQWLPPGCENWEMTSQSGTNPTGRQPLLSDAVWSDKPPSNHGVDRAYGLVGDGGFVQVLNAVKKEVRLTVRENCTATAFDPLTGIGITVKKAVGETWVLPGDAQHNQSYIVRGTYA